VRWTVYCYQPAPQLRLIRVVANGRRFCFDTTTDSPDGVRLAAGSVCMVDRRSSGRIVCSCALARRSRSCRRKAPKRSETASRGGGGAQRRRKLMRPTCGQGAGRSVTFTHPFSGGWWNWRWSRAECRNVRAGGMGEGSA